LRARDFGISLLLREPGGKQLGCGRLAAYGSSCFLPFLSSVFCTSACVREEERQTGRAVRILFAFLSSFFLTYFCLELLRFLLFNVIFCLVNIRVPICILLTKKCCIHVNYILSKECRWSS
jgi:hypothetical protein